ncbi:MAG: hypothetical protein A2135_10595 [Actinobacteria bacterium RBG_16_67_15]|nr:MAG: hypothetical protein A2135_10595 [Actinobacteria bacterium RBG_16_67_15]
MIRRGVVLAGLTMAILLTSAAPAWADPAVPTNYRSRVTDMDPRIDGITIQVTGGDAFLVAAVAPGHVLEIPGYFGEPYLRIDADGTVWRNEKSPARYINVARYGVTIPPEADADAPPDWRQVGGGGRYAWHDHRTHWMSRDLPPTIAGDRAQLIFPWEFDVIFDGVPISVHGELVWFPAENPIGPLFIGILGLAPLAWWRRGRTTLVASHLAGLGAIALLVATMQYAATPVDRPFPSELALPALAVMLAVASVGLRPNPIRATGSRLLAGIALIIWGLSGRDVLTAPVLPSALPTSVERSLVALVLVSAVVLVVVTVSEYVLAGGRAGPTRIESVPA